jgi:hypothetical protein
MGDELDFSAEEFAKMSASQRIRICRLLAKRALKLAELSGSGEHAANYRRIAEEWETLAADIERQDWRSSATGDRSRPAR